MIYYLLGGLLYSTYIQYKNIKSKNRNREHYVGVYLICTFFYPIHFISKNI